MEEVQSTLRQSNVAPSGGRTTLRSSDNALVRAEQDKKNFFERFGEAIDERSMIAGDIIDRYKGQEQGLGNTLLQVAGKVGAGGLMDFMGEVLVSGGRGLSAITPDVLEDPIKDGATNAAIAILNTEVGQAGLSAAADGVDRYRGWSSEHPVAAASLEAVTNIALLAAPVKAKPSTGSVLKKTSDAATRSGTRKIVADKRAFVEDLVTPVRTQKVKEAQVPRTTEQGLFRTSKITPSAAEKASADEIMKLAIKPNRSVQKNREIVAEAVEKEANSLVQQLRQTGASGRFDKQKLLQELDNAAARIISTEEAITGSAKEAAIKSFKRMKNQVENHSNHVSDLLNARRAFDREFYNQGKQKLLDPVIENATTIATREIRQVVNNFMASQVPSVSVKRSLKKQSDLLRALDDITVKAAKEPNNAVARVTKNVLSALTLRNELNMTLAAVTGIGGLGAAAMYAPWILKGGIVFGVGYGATKVALNGQTRKFLGKLTGLADKATLGITDPAVLRQLRADRALLVELLESSKED